MNFRALTRFCSVFYLISKYGVLGENDETKNENIQQTTLSQMQHLNAKIMPIQNDLYVIQKKLERAQRKVYNLQRQRKRKNILIYQADVGVKTIEEIERDLRRMFKDKLGVEVKPEEVDYTSVVRRSRGDPVVKMGLTSWRKKGELLRNARKLKGTGMAITDDYTPEVSRKRKKLIPEMLRLRRLGHYATIKYDRLVVDRKPIRSDEQFL